MEGRKPFPPGRVPPPPEPPPPPSRGKVFQRALGRFYSRFRNPLYLLAGVLIAFMGFLIYNAAQPPPQRLTQKDIDRAVERTLENREPDPSFASRVYPVIRPSLVGVEAEYATANETERYRSGAGFVVNEDGTILTCLHVVGEASKVTVRFADEFETTATLVDAQPENDLAVLSPDIVPSDLIPAVLAGSGSLSVGDEVFAAGHPFGIERSLTAGIVSGLRRSFDSPEAGVTLTDLIQFDAAANPGNSGGPLLNRDGEVVGIVTAIFNPTEQRVFIGIGFAAPIETAIGGGGPPPV